MMVWPFLVLVSWGCFYDSPQGLLQFLYAVGGFFAQSPCSWQVTGVAQPLYKVTHHSLPSVRSTAYGYRFG